MGPLLRKQVGEKKGQRRKTGIVRSAFPGQVNLGRPRSGSRRKVRQCDLDGHTGIAPVRECSRRSPDQNRSLSTECLKEPVSRLANRQDKVRGAFFEGRFRSVAILDDEALLAIGAYIDHFSLNSTRAAWFCSGSPSRPAGFALAGKSGSFNAGLFLRLELNGSSQLAIRYCIELGLE